MITHINKKINPFIALSTTLATLIIGGALAYNFHEDIMESIRLDETMNTYISPHEQFIYIDKNGHKTNIEEFGIKVKRLKINEMKQLTEDLPPRSFLVYGDNKAFVVTFIKEEESMGQQAPK